MLLEILTPDRKVYQGEADQIFVPGSKGAFEILRNHAPIISSLARGTVKFRSGGSSGKDYLISRGVVEVRANHVIILAESVEVYCSKFLTTCGSFGGSCPKAAGPCGLE